MSDELKRKFQNKCVGLTDKGREYIYGTDWKGYAKALEKQMEKLRFNIALRYHKPNCNKLMDGCPDDRRHCTCGLDGILSLYK